MEADEAILICHIGISLMDERGTISHHLAYPADMSVVNDSAYQQQRFLLHNFAFGCAMLVRTGFARSVLPFPGNGVYHDQWLACCAACSGRVIFMENNLLLHRIHNKNFSAILQGITTKKEYYAKKLARDTELIKALSERFTADCNPILTRSEVYSGVYGRASINFYVFNSNGNKGIACGLNNLQKIRDGEPLGGKSSAASDFSTDADEDFLS